MNRSLARKGPAALFAAAAYVTLGGCSILPPFDHPIGPSDAAPTVKDLVTHIQCEIADAARDYPRLQSYDYLVSANLTLDVTNAQGVSPTLSFIDPFAVAGTNLTNSVGGQLTGMQHRTINQTFVLDLEEMNDAGKNDCADKAGKDHEGVFGLEGDLGLAEIIKSGLNHAAPGDFYFKFPGGTQQTAAHVSSAVPTFGSTIDFTVVYGLSGVGPTWTLKHFKGPGGLLTLTRTDKDSLTVSFAPACPAATGCSTPAKLEEYRNFARVHPGAPLPPPPPPTIATPDDKAAAAAAAQTAVSLQILKNVLPSVFQ